MTVDELIQAWNALAKRLELSPVRCLTEPRRKAVSARLRENAPEAVQEALAAVGRSKFLLGQKNGNGHDGWKCNFDFFISARGFARILEGVYGNDTEKPKPDPYYAIKKQIEHYLKTKRWSFPGQPPDQNWPAHLPKSILDPYREAFKAKGIKLAV